MSAKRIHILMTGAGAPGAAGLLRCLQQEAGFRIFLADADPLATGRFLHDEFDTIPKGDAPDFIPAILETAKARKIQFILPLVTRELIPLATHAEIFRQNGIQVLVSPASSLEIANNKCNLYQFLQWRGISLPDYCVVETVEQFKTAVTAIGYPEKAVCFKPGVANGSRGFRILDDSQSGSALLFSQKPDSRYMSYEDAVRILSEAPFPQLLVSEYLPGEEFSVDCLCKEGEARLLLPRRRLKMIQGISVQGEFVRDEEIIRYCRQIIRELKLHGNIGIQVKRNAKGEAMILEINPRLQGSSSTALGAGVNLPVLAIKQEMGQLVPAGEEQIKWGTRFSRYWTDVFY